MSHPDYTQQTATTDPRQFSHLFDALPDDLPSLCEAVRNIYVHFMSGNIPPERLPEVDLRRVDRILARVMELNPAPLTVRRPREERVVGCCRDASLLLCAMLRHKGIPARLRVGFATYIKMPSPNFKVDHVVVEVWRDGAWHLVDAEQSPKLVVENNIDFDVLDIPRNRFWVGGDALANCRAGRDDFNNYGGHPEDTFWRGEWAIRCKLAHDMLMLHREEVLLWDSWGLTEYEWAATPENEAFLASAMQATANAHLTDDFTALDTLYAHPLIAIPPQFISYTPAGEPKQVMREDI